MVEFLRVNSCQTTKSTTTTMYSSHRDSICSAAVAAVGARGADGPRLGDAAVAGDVGRQLARRQGRHQLQDDARGVAERGGELG